MFDAVSKMVFLGLSIISHSFGVDLFDCEVSTKLVVDTVWGSIDVQSFSLLLLICDSDSCKLVMVEHKNDIVSCISIIDVLIPEFISTDLRMFNSSFSTEAFISERSESIEFVVKSVVVFLMFSDAACHCFISKTSTFKPLIESLINDSSALQWH